MKSWGSSHALAGCHNVHSTQPKLKRGKNSTCLIWPTGKVEHIIVNANGSSSKSCGIPQLEYRLVFSTKGQDGCFWTMHGTPTSSLMNIIVDTTISRNIWLERPPFPGIPQIEGTNHTLIKKRSFQAWEDFPQRNILLGGPGRVRSLSACAVSTVSVHLNPPLLLHHFLISRGAINFCALWRLREGTKQ